MTRGLVTIAFMTDEIEMRVKEFVSSEAGYDYNRLTLETTLFRDIGMDGADGWEFIEAFGQQFEVDLSDFSPAKHFGPEGMWFPPLIIIGMIRWLVLGDLHRAAGVTPISVGDLVNAVKAKKWLL